MKTSKDDFKAFIKEAEATLDLLSLRDWRVVFFHEDETDCLGWCRSDVEGKIASVGLCKNWQHCKPTRKEVKRVARHEILHLLLADLTQVGNYRQSTDSDFTTAQHAIIRRLENIL